MFINRNPRASNNSIGGNDSNTVLLLHNDGVDESTTFIDTSKGGSTHTMTANGSAEVDTAQKFFGSGALRTSGAVGGYLSTPNSSDWAFGTGDFTIDFRIRFASLAACGLLGDNYSTGWEVYWDGNNCTFYINGSLRTAIQDFTPSTNTWYHFAFVRETGTLETYLDGVSDSSAEYAASMSSDGELRVGDHPSENNPLYGWMDEVRISNVARWSSAFTPPTRPYF